jgi:hypothetical protein
MLVMECLFVFESLLLYQTICMIKSLWAKQFKANDIFRGWLGLFKCLLELPIAKNCGKVRQVMEKTSLTTEQSNMDVHRIVRLLWWATRLWLVFYFSACLCF